LQYETLAGEFGVQLSGGQRQRLALARVFIRDAPVYLLDEPTANLDPVTEQAIIQSVLARSKGKSLIWITHRLAGLEEMDEIVVLNKGRIEARGTHAELAAGKTRYARIRQLQRDSLD